MGEETLQHVVCVWHLPLGQFSAIGVPCPGFFEIHVSGRPRWAVLALLVPAGPTIASSCICMDGKFTHIDNKYRLPKLKLYLHCIIHPLNSFSFECAPKQGQTPHSKKGLWICNDSGPFAQSRLAAYWGAHCVLCRRRENSGLFLARFSQYPCLSHCCCLAKHSDTSSPYFQPHLFRPIFSMDLSIGDKVFFTYSSPSLKISHGLMPVVFRVCLSLPVPRVALPTNCTCLERFSCPTKSRAWRRTPGLMICLSWS